MGDPPGPRFNKEACGLELNLLTRKEMGGKLKITLAKREDQEGKRQIVLLPKLNCSCLGGLHMAFQQPGNSLPNRSVRLEPEDGPKRMKPFKSSLRA